MWLLLFCCSGGLLFWVLSASSARSAGDFWGFICVNNLRPLACYSPADSADHAEGMQQAALFRRERQVEANVIVAVIAVLLF